jgi:hypothetical protein
MALLYRFAARLSCPKWGNRMGVLLPVIHPSAQGVPPRRQKQNAHRPRAAWL